MITLLLTLLLSACSATSTAPDADVDVTLDFDETIADGSPYVFGATQPRGLSEAQWDVLAEQGFTAARSQADVTELVPCPSPEAYNANRNGCAEPENWDWTDGIYGDNYAQRAIDRGMEVVLTFKNARWNTYPGAPDDEETMPRDLDVFQDILTKLINHYEGGITWLELFNEVDRDPQFHVDGSDYTRESGYKEVVRRGIAAVRASDYPETLIGGPAAALLGAEQVEWMLEEEDIRASFEDIGIITFHDFDNPEYPFEAMETYDALMEQYGVQVPVIRSSFVPEYNRNDQVPGTLYPSPVARHLIGSLQDGLDMAGLWEIQNKSGDDDVRYWFDGDRTVDTAHLYQMMSNTLGLGAGPNNVVHTTASDRTSALGAINAAGERVAVFPAAYSGEPLSHDVLITGLGDVDEVTVEWYEASSENEGLEPLKTDSYGVENGAFTVSVETPEYGVVGMRILQ